MSGTASHSSQSPTLPGEAAMRTDASSPLQTRNKVGCVLAILVSIPNLVGPLFPTPEGEVGPPMLVLVLGTLLGLVTIGAIAVAWSRANRKAIRVASGAVIVAAVTALPAFFAPGVPAGLRVIAAVSVLVSITAVALMLTPTRRSDDSRS